MNGPFLSLKRLSFDETEGKLSYQYEKNSSKQERMDYLEFIAKVTSHIPDKGQVMIRYFGLYSNAHRGKKQKEEQGSARPPIIECGMFISGFQLTKIAENCEELVLSKERKFLWCPKIVLFGFH